MTADGFGVSSQQRRAWQLGAGAAGSPYRVCAELVLRGPFDAAAWRSAWQRVVARQEILRTVFRCPAGLTVPLQVIEASGPGVSSAGVQSPRPRIAKVGSGTCINFEAVLPSGINHPSRGSYPY